MEIYIIQHSHTMKYLQVYMQLYYFVHKEVLPPSPPQIYTHALSPSFSNVVYTYMYIINMSLHVSHILLNSSDYNNSHIIY